MIDVDRLSPVPIRDVWPDEARHLTPWLAENLEHISEALGMDLDLVGAEVQVGSFSADLLLHDISSDEKVVVENMIGNTDHDHVGKLITYAAGLQATRAVLIAETFRPEHRSALQWLNDHSSNSMSFFGLTIKAWRIGDSKPAPQLEVVVEPDTWVRSARPAADGWTSTQLAYRDFWTEFLDGFHRRHPGWSRAAAPARDNWMNFPAGRTGVHYTANFCRLDGRPRFRVELYVDAETHEQAALRFEELKKHRETVDSLVDGDLVWEPLDDRRASRIALYYPMDALVHERERWPEIRTWAIEAIGNLRDTLGPYVKSLA